MWKEAWCKFPKERDVRDNWQLFSGALDSQECENMIKAFKRIPAQEATTFNNDQSHRKSTVRWVPFDKGVVDMLLWYVNYANAVAFNVDIQQEMNEVQFAEYCGNASGKYDWHHDIDWQNTKNFDRKLSVVVQLTHPDAYQGGNFEFSEVESPKKEDWSKQGSILVFPSYLAHRVTEVTKGTRYSLVSWVRGPRWR